MAFDKAIDAALKFLLATFALHETMAFDKAIDAALKITKPKETLMTVLSDNLTISN